MKDPLIGTSLANFKVERLIGQGGMAMVYFGHDVKLHRPVAIKVLDKRYKNHPAYAGRFVNEARMMAKWRHENIIQIYYADDVPGFPYYVMEYVDGQDLGAIMNLYREENTLMPIADALRVGRALANALDYAHRHGVIHRDVKPSNVLLSKDGRVLLGDFGMALEVRDGSLGNIFGTPHYISPEQAKRSADAVPQSDIYSLGVIMYEILTGAVPFNDPSPASIALQHISDRPPAPRSINPSLPTDVETVLLKALEKNARDRYQTGAKLMDALESSFASTGPAKKTPLPPLPVGVPTVRRSEKSIEQISKRIADKPFVAPELVIAKMPATVRASAPERKRKYWAWAVLLLLLGIGAFLFLRSGFNLPASPNAATESYALQTPLEPILETQTSSPTPPPAPTETPIPFTPTSAPSPTVVTTPTILYPEGSHYTLFYNETSFYMLNRSYETRTISAFFFERLDEEGFPVKDRFDGYRWETSSFDYLPRNFCVNITIYGDQDPPYLNPIECWAGIISTVQARFDRPFDVLFWTPKENSTQFRVLWLEEEVARCEIAAGVCEVYIP
jgi:serine/threonine protein kinase